MAGSAYNLGKFASQFSIAHTSGQKCSAADLLTEARNHWREGNGGVSDGTLLNDEGGFSYSYRERTGAWLIGWILRRQDGY